MWERENPSSLTFPASSRLKWNSRSKAEWWHRPRKVSCKKCAVSTLTKTNLRQDWAVLDAGRAGGRGGGAQLGLGRPGETVVPARVAGGTVHHCTLQFSTCRW